MVNKNSELQLKEDFNLIEIFNIIIGGWKYIITILLVCLALTTWYAFSLPEIYVARVLLSSSQDEDDGLSYTMNQFGGLAAMAGISLPSSSNIDRVVATLTTREFLKKFISKNEILPVLFPDLWDDEAKSWKIKDLNNIPKADLGVDYLKGAIEVDVDASKNGLLTLQVSWNDPNTASHLANTIVKQLNEQLRQKAIDDSNKKIDYLERELGKTSLIEMKNILYNLLSSEKQNCMLANVNVDFALEIIDPAIPPKFYEKPKRKLIIVFGFVLGIFLGFIYIFISEFFKKI